MLQVCLQLFGHQVGGDKGWVTRPRIAPAQHIVDYIASLFAAARTSGRQRQWLVSQDLALRLRSILWTMLQEGSSCQGHQVSRDKGWSTRSGIAPAQHIVDYVAGMFPAARTSGRQRQMLVSRDQASRLRSILWIMLQIVMVTISKQRRNEASILSSFSISKRNEPAYSSTCKDRIEANPAYSKP